MGTNPSRKEYFFKIQAADTDLCSLLSRNPRNAYSLLLGCRVTRAWKDFLVSVDWLKASSVLDTDLLVSHCVLWVRFYIFSCKYKSSKPSIVEYIYQVKDNFIIEEQISIIKGKEKNFEEKRKQIIQKRRLFEWALLSSLLKKKTTKIITFRRFGDLMTPLSRNGNKLKNWWRWKRSS